jgi:hypothetical protein
MSMVVDILDKGIDKRIFWWYKLNIGGLCQGKPRVLGVLAFPH